MADAALCCALEGRQLCVDGLERLEPAERAQLLSAIDEHPERLILLAPTRAAALALGDRTVLLVEVPMPHLGEREQAWSTLTGATDTSDVAAKFRLSLAQIAEAAEVAPSPRTPAAPRRPEPADLDLGARHASSSRLGELAARLDARATAGTTSCSPTASASCCASISAYLRHRDRVLSEWGYEKTVARTQGLKVLFAGESGTGKTMAAEVLAGELGLELFRVDLATIVSKYIGETEKNLDRIFDGGRPAPTRSCSSTRPTRCSASAPRSPTPTTATPTSRSPTCCRRWRATRARSSSPRTSARTSTTRSCAGSTS